MELSVRGHNVPNHGPSILAVSIVLVSLSGFAVGTRLVRRLCMVGGGMGVDDWLISFALVSFLFASDLVFDPFAHLLGHFSFKGMVSQATVVDASI